MCTITVQNLWLLNYWLFLVVVLVCTCLSCSRSMDEVLCHIWYAVVSGSGCFRGIWYNVLAFGRNEPEVRHMNYHSEMVMDSIIWRNVNRLFKTIFLHTFVDLFWFLFKIEGSNSYVILAKRWWWDSDII